MKLEKCLTELCHKKINLWIFIKRTLMSLVNSLQPFRLGLQIRQDIQKQYCTVTHSGESTVLIMLEQISSILYCRSWLVLFNHNFFLVIVP